MSENPYRISPYITCQFLSNLVCIKKMCEHPFRISPYITCKFLFNLVCIKEIV